MPARGDLARIAVLLVLLAVVVAVVLLTGWANDQAPPGSRGRVPVTHTSTAP
jgi:hypothetical protein